MPPDAIPGAWCFMSLDNSISPRTLLAQLAGAFQVKM